MTKNWCQGFCRTCGTGCGQYCEQIHRLMQERDRYKAALEELTTLTRRDGKVSAYAMSMIVEEALAVDSN